MAENERKRRFWVSENGVFHLGRHRVKILRIRDATVLVETWRENRNQISVDKSREIDQNSD